MLKPINLLGLVGSLLLLTPELSAQFSGGSGDGYTRRTIIQTDLTGVPAGTRPLYVGGRGDGFDRSVGNFSLSGQSLASLFNGGRGDGFDLSRASYTPNGQDLAGLFGGGGGDGFDRNSHTAALSGQSVAGLFTGGSGDGFDRGAAAGALNGQSLATLFTGGNGDGFDRQAFFGVVTGAELGLYAGGGGDGFDRSLGNFSLSGQSLAGLFSGGRGDGFDTETFYGVIPLPLTLVRFDAFPMKDYVLLKWETEDEIATDIFTIEKTRDGVDFTDVGEVEAAGYSDPLERLHYELEDHTPYTGTSYYRLQTTDFDGVISLSHLVAVTFATAEDWDFTLFPNPNTGRQLGFRPHGLEDGSKLHFEVLDVRGRNLLRERFVTDGRDRRFDLQKKLAAGSYLIRATDAAGKIRTKILIVQ